MKGFDYQNAAYLFASDFVEHNLWAEYAKVYNKAGIMIAEYDKDD